MNNPTNKLKTNRTCFKRLHIIVFCCVIVCSLIIFVAFNFLVHQLDYKLQNSIEGRHSSLKFQLRKRYSKDSGAVLQKLHVSMQEMERKHHQPRSKPNKRPHTHSIRVVAPNKSTLTFPRYSRKSLGAVIEMQPELSPVKGRFVNYSHNYSSVQTTGSIFVYNHSNADPCYVHHISLKYSLECGDAAMNASFVRQVLVTAVQRSGTHFTWEMLNQLGVKVHHEGVGPMGAVGWLYAINAMIPAAKSTNISLDLSASAYKKEHKEQRERKEEQEKEQQKDKQKEGRKDNVISFHRGYIINNPEKLTKHRFRHVFHQVRHPLRVITTLVQRCNSWDRFWNWIGKTRLRGFSEIHSNATALSRAMNLYFLWNRHIETYADIRFQSETTSPRDICRWAGFNDSYCDSDKILASEMSEPILIPAVGAQNSTSSYSSNSSSSSGDKIDSFGVSDGSGSGGISDSGGLRVARQLASVSNDSSVGATLLSTRQSLSSAGNESELLNYASDSAGSSASNSSVVGYRAGSNSTGNNSASYNSSSDNSSDVSADISAGNNSAGVTSSADSNSNVTTVAPKVTWDMLDTENSTLSSQLKAMCVEYGFPLDPDLVPQSAQSFQFKA